MLAKQANSQKKNDFGMVHPSKMEKKRLLEYFIFTRSMLGLLWTTAGIQNFKNLENLQDTKKTRFSEKK